MNILVFNKQKDLKIPVKQVKNLVSAFLSFEKIDCSEVSLYFVSEKFICQLHDQFFQDPTPTDCISFPLGIEGSLGEVFVCPRTALLYAEKKGIDPYRETALYIVHGLLHLIGFDDLEEKQRRIMRKKEKSCMRHLDDKKIFLRPL